MTFFTSSLNSGTLHLQTFAVPVLRLLFAAYNIFFVANRLKNL